MVSEEDKAQAGKYSAFYAEFGAVLKEGLGEDFANRDKLAKLLRFALTQSDAVGVSFADYKARMKDGQKAIYYITADTLAAAKNSPQLELFLKKGIEVLLMTDRVDEWTSGRSLSCTSSTARRRMCEQVSLHVVGLKRIGSGPVVLGQLPQGPWRYLRPDEAF